MKKTLAILLALLAAASITLASCTKEENEGPDGWDDDNDYVESGDDSESESESNSNTNNTPGGDDENNNNNNNNTPDGWSAAEGTLYLGVKVALRSSPSEAQSAVLTTKVYDFGTALTRVRTNGKWEEIKVSGDETLYYVKSIYTTDVAGNFTFTDDTAKPALTLSTTTGNNVCFYKTPFFCDDSETNYANMLCRSGIKYTHLSEGYSLKQVAVSSNGKWIKVEFVGTVTISANNTATYTTDAPGVFYIQSLAFSRGDVTGGNISGDNNPGGDDNIFS